MENLPSSELFSRYRNSGCHACFSELYDRYADYLAGWLDAEFSHSLSAEDLEDVQQETWAALSTAYFRGESEFKTWLFTIAKFRAIDVFRKRREESLADGYEPCNSDRQLRPDQQAIYHEMLQSIHGLARVVLILHAIAGFSLEETARLIGVKYKVAWRAFYQLKLYFGKKSEHFNI